MENTELLWTRFSYLKTDINILFDEYEISNTKIVRQFYSKHENKISPKGIVRLYKFYNNEDNYTTISINNIERLINGKKLIQPKKKPVIITFTDSFTINDDKWKNNILDKYKHSFNDFDEKWKKIILNDIETNYMISNKGNFINKIKKPINRISNDDGYIDVELCINGKKFYVKRSIHKLAAMAFIENDTNINIDKLHIDHKNTVRNDNNVDNLKWSTPKENYHNSLTEEKHCDKILKIDPSTFEIIEEYKSFNEVNEKNGFGTEFIQYHLVNYEQKPRRVYKHKEQMKYLWCKKDYYDEEKIKIWYDKYYNKKNNEDKFYDDNNNDEEDNNNKLNQESSSSSSNVNNNNNKDKFYDSDSDDGIDTDAYDEEDDNYKINQESSSSSSSSSSSAAVITINKPKRQIINKDTKSQERMKQTILDQEKKNNLEILNKEEVFSNLITCETMIKYKCNKSNHFEEKSYNGFRQNGCGACNTKPPGTEKNSIEKNNTELAKINMIIESIKENVKIGSREKCFIIKCLDCNKIFDNLTYGNLQSKYIKENKKYCKCS
jgi:hypothetical protein